MNYGQSYQQQPYNGQPYGQQMPQMPMPNQQIPQMQMPNQQIPQMPMPNQYGQEYGQLPPTPPPDYNNQTEPSNSKIDINEIKKLSSESDDDDNSTTELKKSKIKFNEKPKYQDVWATFLYLCTILVTIAIAYTSIKNMDLKKLMELNVSSEVKHGRVNRFTPLWADGLKGTCIILGCSLVCALFLSLIYILVIHRFPSRIIEITFIMSIIIGIFGTVIGFTVINVIFGIIVLILTILTILVYVFMRDDMEFTESLLKYILPVTRKYKATIVITIIECIFAAIWYLFIGITAVASVSCWQYKNPTIAYVIYVFLLFSFFFTAHVVNNTIHVTVSGLFATYYFRGVIDHETGNIEIDVKNPTLKSFIRAITTSFGSICFGSLIISIANVARVISRHIWRDAWDDDDTALCVVGCCVECLASCVEGAVQCLNIYAFTEVAIYGKSFCQAAKDTWSLFKDICDRDNEYDEDNLDTDDDVSLLFYIGGYAVGLLSSVITCCIIKFVLGVGLTTAYTIYGTVSFLISLMIFWLIVQVIVSGIITTIVCFLEDPEALRQTKPEVYDEVKKVYRSGVN